MPLESVIIVDCDSEEEKTSGKLSQKEDSLEDLCSLLLIYNLAAQRTCSDFKVELVNW